jgi:spermidine/putrescine transport system ATP-binding protein
VAPSVPPPDLPIVQFSGVSRGFNGVKAVDAVNLEIRRGEFFSLLGPSGCGKTTTLRLLAGFEEPDSGEVRIGGEVVNRKRPYQRQIGMVFQNYAIFPHLSVERNVAFGLERHRAPRGEIPARVRQALEMVRLDPAVFARRMPDQLSGGQRQRVALARALVLRPAILLLDEPLGAIDLKLRKEMQLELKQLNRSLGITFVYVTHDQEEALTMSDRIAVMDSGRIVQVGTPAEIYENPRTAFVARFIGESNFFSGRAVGQSDGHWEIEGPLGRFRVPDDRRLAAGGEVSVAVRPEWMDLFPAGAVPAGENGILGTVREVVYLGETLHVVVTLADRRDCTVALRNEGQLTRPLPWRKGDPAAVGWLPEDCQLLEEN